MVEGPKVVLKAQRLRILLNQTLLHIILRKNSLNDHKLLSKFGTKTLVDILSVGKELFLIFGPDCNDVIRFHFGMSGSERISCRSIDDYSEPKAETTSRKIYTASFFFETHRVDFYDTVIEDKSNYYFDDAIAKKDRDIMSEIFAWDEILEMICQDPRPVADCIMDQSIMPGVGNIIKCEGMFLSRVDPFAITSTLPRQVLQLLIHNLRTFSLTWYDRCKRNRPMEMKIYGLQSCSVCLSSVSLVRSGQMQRITYHCKRCQGASSDTVSAVQATSSDFENNNLATAPAKGNHPQPALTVTDCHCKRACSLNRVRKEGENHNRLFWSCSLHVKNKSRCKFFSWADDLFPRCEHKVVSVVRRVLKGGPNNGKFFYCCGKSSSTQCKFFAWVEESPHIDEANRKRQRVDHMHTISNDHERQIIPIPL
jgi:formamidopyrimidine-DNA glycosylase